MGQDKRHFYEFGRFRLDVDEQILLHGGQPVPVPPKALGILAALVQNSGHIVDKDALMKAVWPDTAVEETNLTRNIFTLRQILGESDADKYIETVPRRGYRFVAAVREVRGDDPIDQEKNAGANGGPIRRQHEAGGASRLASAFVKHRWRILAASLGLAVVVAASLHFRGTSGPTRTGERSQVQSIAVLPLKPLSQNADDEPLGLGIADAVITKLSHLRGIVVRPISAVHKYSGQDPLAAGREQRVDAVLEGSFETLGDKIRVTLRLLSVDDGRPLWSYQCDDQCKDVFTMQDSISEQVAEALVLTLTSEERRLLAKHNTENIEAYQAYVMGRYFWNRGATANLKKGLQYFEQAVAKDANYAFAHAGLADCYTMLAITRALPEKEAYPKARAAAIRALEIDNALAEVHTSLGHLLMLDWQWGEAEREFKRAMELNPNYEPAHHWYAIYSSLVGRHEEAIQQMKEALAIDPVSVFTNMDFGWVLFRARHYDQVVEQCDKVLEIEPNYNVNNLLTVAYEQKGRFADAVAARVKALTLAKATPESIASLQGAYATAGMKGYWRKRLAQAMEGGKQKPTSPFNMALLYLPLGDKERALAWLQTAYDERDWGMVLMRTDPRLDSLRSDQRFIALLRRIGFEQ